MATTINQVTARAQIATEGAETESKVLAGQYLAQDPAMDGKSMRDIGAEEFAARMNRPLFLIWLAKTVRRNVHLFELGFTKDKGGIGAFYLDMARVFKPTATELEARNCFDYRRRLGEELIAAETARAAAQSADDADTSTAAPEPKAKDLVANLVKYLDKNGSKALDAIPDRDAAASMASALDKVVNALNVKMVSRGWAATPATPEPVPTPTAFEVDAPFLPIPASTSNGKVHKNGKATPARTKGYSAVMDAEGAPFASMRARDIEPIAA